MKSKVTGFPQQSIDSKVQEYYKLREEAKTIKTRMDTLAKEIKSYASENGVKVLPTVTMVLSCSVSSVRSLCPL